MTLPEARAIGEAYALDVVAVQALNAGSVNSNFAVRARSGERFFLRVYEEQDETGAAAELQMIRELAGLGVPTPAPRERRGGGYVGRHLDKPVGIHPWIDGDISCAAGVTPALARRLGRALAQVHRCSSSLSRIPDGRFGISGLMARLETVDAANRGHAEHTALIRQRLSHYSAAAARLPEGIIHGDLFRDNVLWQVAPDGQNELAALLDFESASKGVFVYDVMVCVHAWCYRSAFDLGLVRALLRGYHEVRPLTPDEVLAMPSQGALAALRFASTRLTDFSLRAPPGVEPVRDYRRFLDRLQALEGGALDPIIKEGMP